MLSFSGKTFIKKMLTNHTNKWKTGKQQVKIVLIP